MSESLQAIIVYVCLEMRIRCIYSDKISSLLTLVAERNHNIRKNISAIVQHLTFYVVVDRIFKLLSGNDGQKMICLLFRLRNRLCIAVIVCTYRKSDSLTLCIVIFKLAILVLAIICSCSFNDSKSHSSFVPGLLDAHISLPV